MEEMLVTWRTAQYGRELFGSTAQGTIERGVWGSGAADAEGVAGPSKVRCLLLIIAISLTVFSQARPSVNQVLLELDVTLSSKERLLAMNPADQETASHIEVLVQVSLLAVIPYSYLTFSFCSSVVLSRVVLPRTMN